ncbi:MAG: peptidylprolyl isomerase [Candidatus Thermoplasmatota archaeon]|nr:peptidylprolyl isomerase [Candidatus Thermoplasmatota archaeon]
MVPVYVLIGIVVLVIGGFFALNQFILVREEYPSDNGLFLDEETVTYGQPYAILDIERFGSIKIELDQQKAPITVANFVKLCDQGFYDGLTFHRVIPDFMIQGGDPSGDGTGGPGYTIESEADNGLLHDRGALAMAKKGEDVRMSGSQFYIVQASSGAHHLDGEHTVFGKVISGMEVVDAIANTSTDANDRPTSSVIIEKAYIIYE